MLDFKSFLCFQALLANVETQTPVKDVYSFGELLVHEREDAPGCKDVIEETSSLHVREESILERIRDRRDKLHLAAQRHISDFRYEVRKISTWIQESWMILSQILRGEGSAMINEMNIEVSMST